MGITTSTGLTSFDKSFYQGINDIAASYIMEKGKATFIPAAIVDPYMADEYKKPIYDFSKGIYGEQDLGIDFLK